MSDSRAMGNKVVVLQFSHRLLILAGFPNVLLHFLRHLTQVFFISTHKGAEVSQ